MCLHCTRPLLRKGCLNPTVRAPAGAPEAAAATAGKLQAAANYALRLERELHGLAGGPWDAPGGRAGHRSAWASRVRLCARPQGGRKVPAPSRCARALERPPRAAGEGRCAAGGRGGGGAGAGGRPAPRPARARMGCAARRCARGPAARRSMHSCARALCSLSTAIRPGRVRQAPAPASACWRTT